MLHTIEDQADTLFASLFRIDSWPPAPAGQERAGRPGFILVASAGQGAEPLGFAHVIEIPGGDHLEQLSVHPSATRRGYGRALLGATGAESRRRGRARLTLRTFADVPWNAPFYRRCGFIESAPDTEFHRQLVVLEQADGLRQGRRIQMTFDLSKPPLNDVKLDR